MKKTFILLSAIFSLIASLNAETHLSGDIGGRNFEPSGNPFVVDQDVVIPKDTKITIKPGCVFLFKSFTGINVYGGLFVEGDLDNPIVFSSVNDANYNPDATQLPNSFDWNGIYVSEESGDVKLRNFKLMYSVFGIKSKKNQITIQNGNFKQNGQFHFTINDNIHYVQDNISYSYNVVKKTEPKATTTDSKPSSNKKETTKSKNPNIKKRKVAAGIFLGVGIISLGTTLAMIAPTISKNDKLKELYDECLKDNTSENERKWRDAEKTFLLSKGILYGTGVLAGVTLPVSIIFMFSAKDKSKTVKKVSINLGAGHEMVIAGFTRYF